jgi:hypothetical protein
MVAQARHGLPNLVVDLNEAGAEQVPDSNWHSNHDGHGVAF